MSQHFDMLVNKKSDIFEGVIIFLSKANKICNIFTYGNVLF